MSTPTVAEKTEPKTLTAYWSSAYFFSVAVLYLWGYWSPFNINVLEYVSLSDVVKTAAYPIASVFVFMAAGALMGEFMFPEGFLPSGGGANTQIGRWLRRAAPAIATGYVIATTLLFLFGPVEKWRVLPVLLAIPVSFALKEAGALRTLIKSERARGAVLFLLAALPPFAYSHGTLRANDIISGKTYSYVVSEVQGHAYASGAGKDVRLRYVGKAGEQYFLYSPDVRSVLVLPMTEAKVLELKLEDGKASSAVLPASAPASATSTSQGTKS